MIFIIKKSKSTSVYKTSLLQMFHRKFIKEILLATPYCYLPRWLRLVSPHCPSSARLGEPEKSSLEIQSEQV
jgi:hypothetical protein